MSQIKVHCLDFQALFLRVRIFYWYQFCSDALIREALDDWQREIRGYRAVDTIKQLRDGTQDVSEQELARALKALESGTPAADVLTQLSRNLTNKFLHAPTVALRSAAEQGDLSLLDATHRLFSIDETEDSD